MPSSTLCFAASTSRLPDRSIAKPADRIDAPTHTSVVCCGWQTQNDHVLGMLSSGSYPLFADLWFDTKKLCRLHTEGCFSIASTFPYATCLLSARCYYTYDIRIRWQEGA